MDGEDFLAILESAKDMWLTAGPYTQKFEREFSFSHGREGFQSVFFNSGSSALLAAISGLKLEPGSEVITSALAFPTTVNPIFQNGLIPVFVDVDEQTLNTTLELVKNAFTPKTRAVVLAHTLGNPFPVKEISEFCKANNLFLIEDCSDALHAAYGDKLVGTFGDLATFSFYPAHHMTTGEGGMVMTRDKKLEAAVRRFRDWGRDCWCETGHDNTCGKRFGWEFQNLPPGYDHKYVYTEIGYNLKPTDLQAALGLSQLKKVSKFSKSRQTNWTKLFVGIKSSVQMKDAFIPVHATAGSKPNWFSFAIHCSSRINRSKVVGFLEESGVGTRPIFAGNLTRQPAYQGKNFRVSGDLEKTDRVMQQTFCVGVHPGIGGAEVAYILNMLERSLENVF